MQAATYVRVSQVLLPPPTGAPVLLACCGQSEPRVCEALGPPCAQCCSSGGAPTLHTVGGLLTLTLTQTSGWLGCC